MLLKIHSQIAPRKIASVKRVEKARESGKYNTAANEQSATAVTQIPLGGQTRPRFSRLGGAAMAEVGTDIIWFALKP